MSKKQDIDIFERLKKRPSFDKKARYTPDIFFLLNFDEFGAYLQVIDSKQNEIDVDYKYYSGHIRDVLKSIEHIKDKNSLRVDWDKPSGRCYLSEYEHLIWQLKKCSNFVYSNFTPIHFQPNKASITIEISGDEQLKSNVILIDNGQKYKTLSFLNENHVFVNGQIFEIEPIGENYSFINHFKTELLPINIEKFLTLLYSYFDNVYIDYMGYKQVIGTSCQTQPTLIIEKIDTYNSLYLRVSTSINGAEPDLLDHYEISRIVSLNEIEKKIVVSEIIKEDVSISWHNINKRLNQIKKPMKEEILNDFIVEENLFIIEENLAHKFIRLELPELLMSYSIFGTEKLKSYKIRAVTPKLNLSLNHGIDFLQGDASLEIDGEIIPLFEALRQYNKTSYIQLSDGTQAIVNQAYINKLERIFKKRKDNVSISFFDLPIVEELIEEKIANETFKASREIFLGFNTLQDKKVSIPKLNATLRTYQVMAYKWLKYLHKHSLGGCLADDMGLGKTLEAITLLSDIYPKNSIPSLIIMPKSLLFNWESEIKRFNPNLSCYIFYGNNRNFDETRKSNIILTTYGTARNDIKILKEETFHYIILDESQNIKNINSQASKAVMLLKSKHRLALSGTPIENNLGELYSLFRFLNPAMFGTINDFNEYYAIPIQKHNNRDIVKELKKKIYPFILRRLKKDVLPDLPDKIEQILWIEMSLPQKRLYESRRQFYYQAVKEQIGRHGLNKSQFFVLQALTELRQIASIPESKSENQIYSPKREVLMENISDAVANQHKVLVYANFINAIDLISQDMEKMGIEHLVMTGATHDRKALVERFQNDPKIQVFILTLKTGGIGLNLTAADTIFIYDPWWNKAAEIQATDRAHRIGQDRTVFSYRLITRSSIEEKIMTLQEKKSALFDDIISVDSASLKTFSETDVEFILGEGNV